MPAYFILLSGWQWLFSDQEWVLRLPGVLFGLGAVAGLWALCRECFTDVRVAWFSVTAFILNETTLWCVQCARPYGMFLFLVVVTVLAWTRWWRDGRLVDLMILAGAVGVGIGTQALHGILIVLLFGLTMLLAATKPIRAGLAAIALTIPPLILSSMMVQFSKSQSNFTAELVRFPVGRGLKGMTRLLFGDYAAWTKLEIMHYLGLAVLVGLVFGTIWLFRSEERTPLRVGGPPIGWLLGFWLTVPLLVLVYMDGLAGKSVLRHARYYSVMLPGLMMLVGIGLTAATRFLEGRWGAKWAAVPMLAMCLLMMPWSIRWMLTDGDGPADFVERVGVPEIPLIGGANAMRYEYRNNPNVQVQGWNDSDEREELITRVNEVAAGGNVIWVLVYDNQPAPPDTLMKSPAPGWQVREEWKSIDLKAQRWERVGEGKPPK